MCSKGSAEIFSMEKASYPFHFQLMLLETIQTYQDCVILMDTPLYFCKKL